MIEKFLGFMRDVFNFSQKLQSTSKATDELQRQVKEMSDALKYLLLENERLREYIELRLQNEATARDNALLRLKIEMLESGRALPPSTPPRED